MPTPARGASGVGLGGPYADRATLKRRMSIPDTNTLLDSDMDDALLSASNAINSFCNRQFGRTDLAEERTYVAGRGGVDVDDFWSTEGLLVDGADYSSWTLEPVGGYVNGVPGWPYNRLVSQYATHPVLNLAYYGISIAVTALWGWAEVPAEVKSACLLLAADDLKAKDAPFGVAGFGDYVVRVRSNPRVAEKLAPFVREPLKVAS